jgi:hypothetical protein
VEFELNVNFCQVNPMRHKDDVFAPHTVTSRDLKSNNDCAATAHFLRQEKQDESQAGGITIVKIGRGQHLKLKTAARMGISKEMPNGAQPLSRRIDSGPPLLQLVMNCMQHSHYGTEA